MPDIWRVYRIKKCRYTHPPKDKFVVIVCRDIEYMGFIVNSKIHPFILKRPHLLKCQVTLTNSDYGFLFHDSYLDCGRIYAFKDAELIVGLELVNDKTKADIKSAVVQSKTIEKKYKDLILSNR
jgi:hypothetical protein